MNTEKSRVRSRNDCQKVLIYRKNSKLSLKEKSALSMRSWQYLSQKGSGRFSLRIVWFRFLAMQ